MHHHPSTCVITLAAATVFVVGCFRDRVECDDRCQSKNRLERECFQGSKASSCHSLAYGAFADEQDKLWQRGCSLGAGESCFAIGKSCDPQETIIHPDPVRAAHYYGRACEVGLLDGCVRGGGMKLGGSDATQGRAWLSRACDGKNGPGCRQLARAFERGAGGPEDPGKALQLAESSCSFGHAEGCELAAYYHYAGVGCDPEAALSSPRFALACEKGAGASCNVVRLLEHARDGKRQWLLGILREIDGRVVIDHHAAAFPPVGEVAMIACSMNVKVGSTQATGWAGVVRGNVVEASPRVVALIDNGDFKIKINYKRENLVMVEWPDP